MVEPLPQAVVAFHFSLLSPTAVLRDCKHMCVHYPTKGNSFGDDLLFVCEMLIIVS